MIARNAWAGCFFVVLLSTASAGETRLPFADADYSTDATLCPLTPEQRIARDGDLVGNKLRVIAGDRLTNGYEMSCTVKAVSIKGASVRFEALCNAEGELEQVQGSWKKLSGTSFRIGERVFEKCE
jgi:hypothetical protein